VGLRERFLSTSFIGLVALYRPSFSRGVEREWPPHAYVRVSRLPHLVRVGCGPWLRSVGLDLGLGLYANLLVFLFVGICDHAEFSP